MNKYIDSLKNDKQKLYALLDKIGKMRKTINCLAWTVSFLARIIAPLYAVYTFFKPKCKKQIINLPDLLRSDLQAKRDRYMSLMKEKSDNHGFIEHDCCDALLFTSLVSAVGWKALITKARDENGAWHRRDVDDPCYPGGSRSTISRDMLLGLMWYIWRDNRLDIAQDLWDYGVEHNWIMGEGDISRLYFTPGLQATLAEIIYQLGGRNYWFARNMPQSWIKGLEGYQAHLEVLHILLRGELLGYITTSMKEVVQDLATRHVKNHLYTVAEARYAPDEISAKIYGLSVLIGLDDENFWPNDRLPTDADRSSRWTFENNDLSKGTDSTIIHTGGDLVFCASLILDYSDLT